MRDIKGSGVSSNMAADQLFVVYSAVTWDGTESQRPAEPTPEPEPLLRVENDSNEWNRRDE